MSSIPAVIDFLVADWAVALPDAVQVIDGPPVVNFEQDGVAVGWVTDELSVVSKQSDASLANRREAFDVHCFMWARTGDELVKPVRDRIFGYLDTINTRLKGSRLGGAVARAQVANVDYDQGQTADGAWATIGFAVHCEAL